MSREIFVLACQLAEKLGGFIELSGGEPTLHPLLWDFMGIALKYMRDKTIYITTNGKKTEDALALARAAELRTIHADLSLDSYHELIDYEVVQAFENSHADFRRIRDITHGGTMAPAPFGRAASWADPKDIRCPGNDISVTPDGTIYACGCMTRTYGTVYKPELPDPIPEEWCPDELGW